MNRLAILLTAASAFAMPAHAADIITEEPPAPAPVIEAIPTWTGLYLGIQGGGAFNPSDGSDLRLQTNGFAGPIIGNGVDAFGDNFSSSFDSSFVGGGHIGYDYQIGRFVVGALVDINYADVSQTESAFSNTPAFYTAERDIDFLVTGRLRAGYTVTDRFLAYATGGLAYADVDYDFRTDSPAVRGANPPAIIDEDDDDFGFTVGGGVDFLVTDHISFGAEYLYTNLGSSGSSTRISGGPFDGSGSAVIPGNSTDFESRGDFDFHTVTAKVAYRFN